MNYSIEPKYFAKSIGKYIGKNLSCEYSQKLLDRSKKSIQKTADAAGALIGKTIANKITKIIMK